MYQYLADKRKDKFVSFQTSSLKMSSEKCYELAAKLGKCKSH